MSEGSMEVKRGRGRPRIHASAADRTAAYRERHQLEQLNIDLPADLVVKLRAYQARQHMDGTPGLSLSGIIERLLRSQLLRKR